MAIAFVSAATAPLNSAGTSLACSVPAGVVDGNLMVTLLELNAAVSVTPPTGWTHLPNFPLGSGTNTLDGYYRIANSEPASYTWNFGSAKCLIASMAYSGASAAAPIEASTPATSSSPNAASPSVTVSANDWIIAAFSDRDSSAGSSWTTPTGTAARANMLNSGSSEGSLAVFDTNGPVAAGSYSYASTSSTTQSNTITASVAILAATAAGSSFVPAEISQYGGFF